MQQKNLKTVIGFPIFGLFSIYTTYTKLKLVLQSLEQRQLLDIQICGPDIWSDD
jgi:hypothetical protein